jgi:hypothetical protein
MKKLFICSILFLITSAHAVDHQIFNIAQDIPMGYKDEQVKRNYFVNLGSMQGVKNGTTLDVFRNVSVDNPYDTNKRMHYKVKIGELQIIHSDSGASIAKSKSFLDKNPELQLEINAFMIGDHVAVSVK